MEIFTPNELQPRTMVRVHTPGKDHGFVGMIGQAAGRPDGWHGILFPHCSYVSDQHQEYRVEVRADTPKITGAASEKQAAYAAECRRKKLMAIYQRCSQIRQQGSADESVVMEQLATIERVRGEIADAKLWIDRSISELAKLV